MKKLPIGVQSIEKILRKGTYVYVDKTGFAKQLMDGGSHYFMSRPRRFGKSLFLNTLEEIFKGNKQLFKDCQIYKSDYEWEEYPVLYFDFAQILSGNVRDLEESLKRKLASLAESHKESVALPSSQEGLANLVKALANKNRVVVLVDEYDQPIINNLNNPEIAEQNRDLLKNFFGALKSLDKYLKFTFVTGVSKFSQVSLFSGPNNLKDITMDSRYAAMMGYAEEDVKECFAEHIQAIVDERNQSGNRVTKDEILEEVRRWYNGYRFSEGGDCVYNPFSTLNYMDERKAAGYWYSSGTPTFLIDQLKDHEEILEGFVGAVATRSELLDISSLKLIDPIALMFQTGYLTIQNYDSTTTLYHLGFPNQEVSQAFSKSLLQAITKLKPRDILVQKFEQDLENCDYTSFFKKVNAHFAKIPYQLFERQEEKFYHGLLAMLLHTAEIKFVKNEDTTNIGRIDIVVESKNRVHIFELKLDKTPQIALDQAQAKKYKEKYLHQGKEISVLGVNFCSKSRNVAGWKGSLFSSDGELIRELLLQEEK